jgi:hypothetical protein
MQIFYDEEQIARSNGHALDSHSSKELVGELYDQAMRLVKDEVHLAKVEIRDEIKEAGRAGQMAGIGGYLLNGAFFVLLFGCAFLLSVWLPLWASALIVGGICALVGGVVLSKGIHKFRHLEVKPRETLDTLKEDGQWMKSTMRDVKSRTRASV